MSTSPQVTVVICSRDRVGSLELTLHELCGLLTADDELIMVDNGSSDNTAELMNRTIIRGRTERLFVPVGGKSTALNAALDAATGDFIVFTDDDISFSPQWLRSMLNAFKCDSSVIITCGPIIPLFPETTPLWLLSHEDVHGLYGKFAPPITRGPLPLHLTPYGANFAVRRSAIPQYRFRDDLGPSAFRDLLLGEDTAFINSVRRRKQDCIYLPEAEVRHRIRDDQLTPEWLSARAFSSGRTFALIAAVAEPLNDLTAHIQVCQETFCAYHAFALNFFLGQLSFQDRLPWDDVVSLRDILFKLDPFGHNSYLCQSGINILTSL